MFFNGNHGVKFQIKFGAFLFVIFFILSACQPKQSKLIEGKFESYIVDKGDIESYEAAEGMVEPANEVILLSPASSIVKQIIKGPGQRVTKGGVILKLDTKPVNDKIEQLNDQLAVKQNSLEKTRLNAKGTRADLSYNEETKKLKITSIKSTLADQEQLFVVGGISQAKVDKTKQELVLAEKDLKLAQQKNSIKLAQLATDEKGLLLQIEMQQKELEQQKELLNKMDVKAPADGIILNIHAKEGEKIQGERVLVNVSDLTRLKVDASIAENHRWMIKIGRRAYIVVGKHRLQGRISSIMPMLDNGNLRFSVVLTEDDQSKLIPNQKVELQIVKRARYDVLRLKKGDLLNFKKKQSLYILNGDSAIRKDFEFGLITNEYAELKKGATQGSEVVISSSLPLSKLNTIKIEKH
ncbi:efflux RND transporter periplasmic adaptor subunit [Saccharicrinis sp. 156]|uniref:efflux RND transporter periplasmic adaptor subunit n=1 Tax=Saccharicrinis sp. 156 TaxID=3417574 RepID=UPI003D32A7D5